MPVQNLSLDPGGPPRVAVQWEGFSFKNAKVLLDGALLGEFADRDALIRGGSFPLPDGSTLSVQLVRNFWGTELRVLREGMPLPGSASDPVRRLTSARRLLYAIAAVNGLLGVASLGNMEALNKLGAGPWNLIYTLLYGGLGLLAGRSRVALVSAIVLLAGDSLVSVMLNLGEGKSPPMLMLFLRATIVVTLCYAFGAVPPKGAGPPVRWALGRHVLLAFLLLIEGLVLVVSLLGVLVPGETAEVPQSIELAPAGEFWSERGARPTLLTRHQPSPQTFREIKPPPGVEPVSYPSGPLLLKGWYVRPAGADSERRPGVVYLHGGFAFGAEDIDEARPFLDAGVAVLFATLRGENGNPGSFELMYGEVDDAAAAVQWLAARPEVDRSRVFAFGHSVGGGVAALLSLVPDLPLSSSGSAGGLYHEAFFTSWKSLAPFDVNDPRERRMRSLLPHLASMERPHYAYVGKEDGQARLVPLAEQTAIRLSSPLNTRLVDGDHHSSLASAERMFFHDVIRSAPSRP
jgi:acetyl esterase/lipase